jgi:NAD-dependent deacetylase
MRRKKVEFSTSVIAALDPSKRIVVLTGAGISAESGVPTFRGEDGLWRRYRAEDLATPAAFEADPTLVWEWYDWRRGIIGEAEPNAGHLAIAEMERIFPHFSLITQNVDGLHRRAGNSKVIEIHGNLWQVRCVREGVVREDYRCPLPEIPPRCECGALLRPHVVWFGESLDQEDVAQAYRLIEECDFLLVVGTSAVVQPVASFPLMAKRGGAFVMEVNMDPTPLSSLADESIQGKAGEVLPAFLEKIKEHWGSGDGA